MKFSNECLANVEFHGSTVLFDIRIICSRLLSERRDRKDEKTLFIKGMKMLPNDISHDVVQYLQDCTLKRVSER